MKDLGPTKNTLGLQIDQDRKVMKIWLSQNNYIQKVLLTVRGSLDTSKQHFQIYNGETRPQATENYCIVTVRVSCTLQAIHPFITGQST